MPKHVKAALFDLDGVLTSTALQHRTAWKSVFDDFLRGSDGAEFVPFSDADYLNHVDGRPRSDGVREFLASRDIHLPEGGADDVDADTVHGIGNRKNRLLLELIDREGVTMYPSSVPYLTAVRDAGIAIGVVTSSANGASVLDVAELSGFVDARIDGVVIAERGIRGKPAPDSFLAGAAELGVDPGDAAVFEDAIAGVAAGRAGKFGYVVGIDRNDRARDMYEAGADIVVEDLAELEKGR